MHGTLMNQIQFMFKIVETNSTLYFKQNVEIKCLYNNLNKSTLKVINCSKKC